MNDDGDVGDDDDLDNIDAGQTTFHDDAYNGDGVGDGNDVGDDGDIHDDDDVHDVEDNNVDDADVDDNVRP